MSLEDCKHNHGEYYVADTSGILLSKKSLKRQNAVDENDMKDNQTENTNKGTKKKISNEDRNCFSSTEISLSSNSYRHLPFQHSTTSTSSVTQSLNLSLSTTPTPALVRGSSCSLADIPSSFGSIQQKYPRRQRQRLQIDLTRKRSKRAKKSSKKWQKTIFCAEFCFVAFCVVFIVLWICFA